MNTCFRKILIVATLLLLGGCAKNDDIASAEGGSLLVSPSIISFNANELGNGSTFYVTLRNNSSNGNLIIKHARIEEKSNGGNDQREIGPGSQWINEPVTLAPNESKTIEILYTPLDRVADKGSLILSIEGDPNLPDGIVKIPISSLPLGPKITTVRPVVFSKPLQPTEWACNDVLLQNIGETDLSIQNTTVTPQGSYFNAQFIIGELSEEQREFCKEGNPQPYLKENVNRTIDQILNESLENLGSKGVTQSSNIPAIAPQGKIWVRYFFTPQTISKAKAKLTLETNMNSNNGYYTIPLQGNNNDTCLTLDTVPINFQDTLFNSTTDLTFLIENCSATGKAIKVQDIEALFKKSKNSKNAEIPDDIKQTIFKLSAATSNGKDVKDILTDGNPDTAIKLTPNQTIAVTLTFAPKPPVGNSIATQFSGLFKMKSDSLPPVSIDINGKGAPQIKPVAVAIISKVARYQTSSNLNQGSWESEKKTEKDEEKLITITPLSEITLSSEQSSSGSIDKNNLEYEWECIGDNCNLIQVGTGDKEFDPKKRNPNFRINLAGRYAFRLKLKDTQSGVSSDSDKEASLVHVIVKPDAPLFIELTWKASQDISSGAFGPDADLFVVQNDKKYRWQDVKHSVNFDNKHISNTNCIMSLNRDDRGQAKTVNGGPEIVSVQKLAGNTKYSVGVHFFQAQGAGDKPIYAYIKIFVNGNLYAQTVSLPPPRLLSYGQFWHVYDIVWNETNHVNNTAITIVDKVYENIAHANLDRTDE